MKLLLCGPTSPFRGGIAAVNDAILLDLQKQHDVTVWNFHRMYPSFLFPGSSQFRPEPNALEIGERVLDSIGFWKWFGIRRRLRREKFDAIIIPYWHPFFAPMWLSMRIKGTKFILIGHNVLPHESFPMGEFLSRKVVASADGIMTLGRSELERAKTLGFKGRGSWHPSPMYPSFLAKFKEKVTPYAAPFDQKRPTILFFGLIRDYKGLDVLLDAFAMPELTGTNLLIAGEGYSNTDELRRRLKQFPGRVYWYDHYVADDDVPAIFAAADVIALPYKDATSTGILPIAYAAGLPAVVTRVGSLPDLVREGKTGAIIPPNDAKLLAFAIRKWLFDDVVRERAKSVELPAMVEWMQSFTTTMDREVL